VRFIGVSNMPAWQVIDSLWVSKVNGLSSFVTCQDEFSLLVRGPEKELIPAMEAHGLGLLPYFPLASGVLSGKYLGGQMPEGTRIAGSPRLRERVMTEKNVGIVEGLAKFARDRGHSLLELAFGWLASHSVISSVIAGATKPEQIVANTRAADWELTADEMASIGEILAA